MSTNIYQQRWNHALKLAHAFNKAAEEEGVVAFIDGGPISVFPPLFISDEEIGVKDENCFICLFENNVDFDHGMHNTIVEITDIFTKSLALYKKIDWNVKNN